MIETLTDPNAAYAVHPAAAIVIYALMIAFAFVLLSTGKRDSRNSSWRFSQGLSFMRIAAGIAMLMAIAKGLGITFFGGTF